MPHRPAEPNRFIAAIRPMTSLVHPLTANRACLTLLLGFLAGCGDQGPESGPGTITATLTGPEATQGAAEFRLVGPGIQAVRGIDGQLFSQKRGDTVNVVIVRETPGPLSFSIQLQDTTAAPIATVVEVAGPDNALRSSPTSYSVRMGGGG